MVDSEVFLLENLVTDEQQINFIKKATNKVVVFSMGIFVIKIFKNNARIFKEITKQKNKKSHFLTIINTDTNKKFILYVRQIFDFTVPHFLIMKNDFLDGTILGTHGDFEICYMVDLKKKNPIHSM